MTDRWVRLLATGFGAGMLRPASGTWGTLAAVPVPCALGLLLPQPWFTLALLLLSVVGFIVGVRVCTRAEALFGAKDPHPVVFDEMVGFWICVCAVPFQLRLREVLLYGFAFLAFRALDVIKPFGIRQLQELEGGLGIMIDDAAAAVLTLACVMGCAGLLDHTGLW